MEEALDILNSRMKPKEKQAAIVEMTRLKKLSIENLLEILKNTKDSYKGTILAVLAEISKENPEFVAAHLDFVITYINHKAPRVMWESSEIVANVSSKYPNDVAYAIPKLIQNLSFEGTVVRWSAAFALTNIALANPNACAGLIPIFEEQLKKELSSGIIKMYQKTLKSLSK